MTSPYSFDQCVCIPPSLSLSPMHSYTHTQTPWFCFLETVCFFSFVLTTWKRVCWWRRAGEQIEASGCVVACVRVLGRKKGGGVRSGGSGLRVCVRIVGHGSLSCVHCGPWNKKKHQNKTKQTVSLCFF